jgi:glycosyltransferase involved in cell wall biosynthesis
MSRGKIIQIIDSLGPGGAERLLVAYAPRIAKLGFDVEVVVLHEKKGNFMRESLEAAGITVTMVEVSQLRRVDQILGLHRALKRFKPDLIHAHLEFASMLGSISGALTGTPVVATLHTLDEPNLGSRRDTRRWLMYRAMATFADRVICLTKRNAEIARQTGLGNAPLVILPNGVEIDIFDAPLKTSRADLRATFGIPETAPLAVALCVLRPEKALDRLLRAFPEVVRSQPDAHLLIVGDGPMMEPLTAMTEAEGLTDRVHFAGYRTDVADVMRASDLFVLPTMFDAQPTVIMEAMASRLPVVSTTFSGIPDMVENGVHGTLVEPGNVPQLAHALADMMANPEKAKAFGEAGRKRAVEAFSMDRQIERLAQLYDELIAGRRRAA